jgi:phosphotransferase system  glucose/maltose/N-acetylglucosamine-specific IIC component
MRQHLAAVAAGLALIFAALFTIKVAQGEVGNAVVSAIVAFCFGLSACAWYFGKEHL